MLHTDEFVTKNGMIILIALTSIFLFTFSTQEYIAYNCMYHAILKSHKLGAHRVAPHVLRVFPKLYQTELWVDILFKSTPTSNVSIMYILHYFLPMLPFISRGKNYDCDVNQLFAEMLNFVAKSYRVKTGRGERKTEERYNMDFFIGWGRYSLLNKCVNGGNKLYSLFLYKNGEVRHIGKILAVVGYCFEKCYRSKC